jgi:type VI secretion system protein ImpK
MTSAETPPRGSLALAFQEVLTVIVRIRANRQNVSDGNSFRTNMREALKAAVREARRHGYTNDEIQFGMLAVVGFLDESILNADIPALAEWPRETLSHELFGHHLAGEIFFDNLDRLLGLQDSPGLAEVLDVYRLCLLLGFRGKFGPVRTAEIKALTDAAAERIRRIRGSDCPLFPADKAVSPAAPTRATDKVRRRAFVAAAVTLIGTGALFATYHTALNTGLSEVRSVVVRGDGE